MFVLNRDDMLFRIPCSGLVPVEDLPAAVERSARRLGLRVAGATEVVRLVQGVVVTAAKLTCGRLPVVYVISSCDGRRAASTLVAYSVRELRSEAVLNYFSLLENKVLGPAVAELLATVPPSASAPALAAAQGGRTVVIGSAQSSQAWPASAAACPGASYTVTVDEYRSATDPAPAEDPWDDAAPALPQVQRELLYVSQADALYGCVKEIVLDDGRRVRVPVPAGAEELTRVAIPNAGSLDRKTGVRGTLEVQIVYED